uniref:Ig-like domain-containing protein n=1 Tax=Seriola lalandi dorsalis TaxID=1841481 RepID=A0A3B4XYY5_SERLL
NNYLVIQPTADVTAAEGDTVTLDCTFETTDSFPYLFWYKQEENDFPKFLLQGYSGTKNTQDSQENRFDATIKNKSVPLTIQKLQVSDSAVYYCALRPTVTGNTKTLSVQKAALLLCPTTTPEEQLVVMSFTGIDNIQENHQSSSSFTWELKMKQSLDCQLQ